MAKLNFITIDLCYYNLKKADKQMGCTTSEVDTPATKIVNVQPKIINYYIDQLPLIVIEKIKQKFDYYCDDKFQLNLNQFVIMHSSYFKSSLDRDQHSSSIAPTHIKYSKQILQKLYDYYSDMKQTKLTFKRFIVKYAILNKCEQTLFSKILLFLYSSNKNISNQIENEDYAIFIKQQRKFFSFQPTEITSSKISQEQFNKFLNESGFLWGEIRKKFSLIEKDDIPFQSISRGLIEMDVSDFEIGQQYYLLSSAWFERWSYYYQGANAEQDDVNFKSTKLIKRKVTNPSINKRASINNRKSSSRKDISFDENTWVIQRPKKITHQQIEGEYKGELKQNLKSNYEIRIISKQLWQMFKKTMQPESQFKRVANSVNTLDLYPKFVYFLKTDRNGKILDSTFQIIQVPIKRKLKQFFPFDQSKQGKSDNSKRSFFIKNFGDNIWTQEKQETALGMCSTNFRFFVIQTNNKEQFIQNYFRKKKQIKNLTYGDRVYSFFTFNKKVMPAYIIRMISQQKVLIHYIDFNYKYEIQVDIESLMVDQENVSENKNQSAKKLSEMNDVFSYKGIQNIGNTCFINAVIQCMIATPILQQYLRTKKINNIKQPLLHQISELANLLLANKKASPIKLKKTIDMQLQIFSGNDQHDAQQFLSFLIDKLNKQIKQIQKQDETVLQFLFRGKGEFTLQCLNCQSLKKNQQQLAIVSLPIPEPEYNTYTMFVFPIYDSKIRKIVLRLHKNSRVIDLLSQFQRRLGRNSIDFIFIQCHSGVLKKIRHDLFEDKIQTTNLMQTGLTPTVEIHCFQRFHNRQFQQILEENKKKFKQANYFDYKDPQMKNLFYGKFLQNKQRIQIMNEDNSISTVKVKPNMSSLIFPLGSLTKQLIYKKIHQRKYNEILQKMQFFGIHYMIAYPKQINFTQLEKLIDLSMRNFVEIHGSRSKKSYLIKICQFNKQKCIYCSNLQGKLNKKQDFKRCCRLTQEQMNMPIIWVARQKTYTIFVDWESTQSYNSSFGSVEMDALSATDEKKKNLDKVEVQDCLKLYQKPQSVQMQCQKCKHKQQIRTEIMKYVPHILILHMKQYRVTPDMTFCKMDVNLKWIQFLDISNYSVGQKGTIYELYAYVRHSGTNQSGHYTCAIKRKHPFQNKRIWVNFDDELTQILESEQKNIDSAYLLFFKRIDMPNSAYINFTNF